MTRLKCSGGIWYNECGASVSSWNYAEPERCPIIHRLTAPSQASVKNTDQTTPSPIEFRRC